MPPPKPAAPPDADEILDFEDVGEGGHAQERNGVWRRDRRCGHADARSAMVDSAMRAWCARAASTGTAAIPICADASGRRVQRVSPGEGRSEPQIAGTVYPTLHEPIDCVARRLRP